MDVEVVVPKWKKGFGKTFWKKQFDNHGACVIYGDKKARVLIPSGKYYGTYMIRYAKGFATYKEKNNHLLISLTKRRMVPQNSKFWCKDIRKGICHNDPTSKTAGFYSAISKRLIQNSDKKVLRVIRSKSVTDIAELPEALAYLSYSTNPSNIKFFAKIPNLALAIYKIIKTFPVFKAKHSKFYGRKFKSYEEYLRALAPRSFKEAWFHIFNVFSTQITTVDYLFLYYCLTSTKATPFLTSILAMRFMVPTMYPIESRNNSLFPDASTSNMIKYLYKDKGITRLELDLHLDHFNRIYNKPLRKLLLQSYKDPKNITLVKSIIGITT